MTPATRHAQPPPAEDLRPGDVVALAPAEETSSARPWASAANSESVDPLRVVRVHLPLVLVQDEAGRYRIIDVRRQSLVRLELAEAQSN